MSKVRGSDETHLQSLLACPRCHNSLAEDSESESWICANCGKVAHRIFGFPDFLGDRSHLAGAADGVFDLKADEAFARELARSANELSFDELRSLAVSIQSRDEEVSGMKQRARERFNKNYFKMVASVSVSADQACLSKVNPHLKEIGKPEIGGRYALEAGGGHGLFLPGFSRIFEFVVFLDCSLVNLVLARKLSEQSGANNIAFIRGDAHALPLSSGVFDLVHEDGVIEHVADPANMVKEGLRVTGTSGTYVCLSPNRFSLAPEPHFRLPGFGFFPRAVRRPLISWLRGFSSEAGTDPRSLRQLRKYFAEAGEKELTVFFLPRRLEFTARKSFLRRIMRGALGLPAIGSMVSGVINGPLLGLMPYHIAVVSRGR